MTEIFTVFVQIERPRGDFHGRVVEGCYIVENGEVVLVDRHGNEARDDQGKRYAQKLGGPGDNPKQLAGIMTKQLRKALRGNNAAPRGFSGPIHYSNKTWKKV